jgi:hypothetical protein
MPRGISVLLRKAMKALETPGLEGLPPGTGGNSV